MSQDCQPKSPREEEAERDSAHLAASLLLGVKDSEGCSPFAFMTLRRGEMLGATPWRKLVEGDV